jgi:hypothetical protein
MLVVGITVLSLTGCQKFVDIQKKGYSTLETVEDLDLIMNHQYYGYINNNISYLANDQIARTNITSLYNDYNRSPLNYVYTFYDDSQINRAEYTATETSWTSFYEVIGKVANAVLANVDTAKGDRAKAEQLKAEAYIIRAYFHWMLVNIFAKPYNEATAATDGGIPYAFEDEAVFVPKPQRSVAKVYEFILADLKSAFDLNTLQVPSSNRQRINSAFAHAVAAKVYMSMGNYQLAAQEAAASLAIESTVDDYNSMVVNGKFIRGSMSSREDLFYPEYTYIYYIVVSNELIASFEKGDVFWTHVTKRDQSTNVFPGAIMLSDSGIYFSPSGLKTVDMYLTQAECLIRSKNIAGAMQIINDIRRKRIDPAEFTELSATDEATAISYLKRLERTENFYGIKRYMNLKRWNLDAAWQENVTRTMIVNDVEMTFTLTPNSPLWILPIPKNEVDTNPNISQNY